MEKILFEEYDVLLITSATNIRYVTGFMGSFGMLFLFPNGEKILFSDGRYTQMAQKLCDQKGMEYREVSQQKYFWSDFAKKKKIKIIGLESEHISLEKKKTFEEKFPNQKFFHTKGVIEKLRQKKTEEEIELLTRAAWIGDRALQKVVDSFEEGITEKQLAWIFEQTARKEMGADGLSFDPIVAFGKHSAVPHHHNTDKKLEQDMPILIDCGVKYGGYCSDLTRCFWFGERKGAKFKQWEKTYQLVHAAQKEGIKYYIVGKRISEADAAARKVLGDQEKYFIHSLGHGVGLDIHEYPGISSRATEDELFTNNMVVTAEPGLYYPDEFGIRIEDLLVVRKDGAEFLSGFGYEGE